MRRVSLFVVLLAFWLALSGHVDKPQMWIAALVSCTLAVVAATRMRTLDHEGLPSLAWFAAIGYACWLFREIVIANFQVAKLVWSPKLRIDPRLIEVPHELDSAVEQMVYANSITLTPGTVTIAVQDRHLLVHSLTPESRDGLLGGEMHRRVKTLSAKVPNDA